MTDVNDLHEPNDREPECETEFLSPEELLDAIDDPQVRATVEALLADRRYLMSLPTREEWAVTENESTPPRSETVGPFTADGAMRAAARHGVQAWRRIWTADPVVIRDWEPIDSEPPF